MATPHVAGAAALLAAEHPDFTGQQLKEALMSATKPTVGVTPFQGGNRRLDLAAATAATVFATASADFGYPDWPNRPRRPGRAGGPLPECGPVLWPSGRG
ncbi:S8 family serine peptidase [Micromonospora sp. NPDC005367]|uniref:S8 family serine peptidase n=1 Tax=Micromonospora sp. NPDC005367 TaxID=3155590 RepID=UPI0033A7E3A2